MWVLSQKKKKMNINKNKIHVLMHLDISNNKLAF